MRRVCMIFCVLWCCQFSKLLAANSYLVQQLQINPAQNSFATQYPIVLQHGIFGFKKLLFIEYFHQIPRYLREGGFQVFVTQVDPVGSIAERAFELGQQIDEILALTGAKKVNIVGHSMGGLDARYLVGQLGYDDRVASISMIATPNRGSYVADFALTTVLRAEKYRRHLLSWMGVENVGDQNVIKKAIQAIHNVSQEFIEGEFNPNVLDKEGVYYQSWAGNSSVTGTLTGDRLNPLFLLTYPILKWREGLNDGLVTVRSAKWGTFQGYVPADHLDQIGFILGNLSPRFRYKKFYVDMVEKLAKRGY